MPVARILFVEDDETFAQLVADVLRAAGFEVVLAPSYREALDIIERPSEIVDLLLTDIVMPSGMNGFALARMARLRREGLRVLHITGYDVPTNEASGKVIRKPIANADLVREIRSALAEPLAPAAAP
jgi:CheY-like chemotaxis protein